MTRDIKIIPNPIAPLEPKEEEVSLDGERPRTQYASQKEFETAHRKVSTLHKGLFRRLAEHDRQR